MSSKYFADRIPRGLSSTELRDADAGSQVRKEEQTIIGLCSDSAPFERTSKNEMPMPSHKRDNLASFKLNSGTRANCEEREGGRVDAINNSPRGPISSKFPDLREKNP